VCHLSELRKIQSNLSHPPKKYKPFVRWWWFGNSPSKEEISREMKDMKEKGIGGVEIQPIYSALEGYIQENPIQKYQDVQWLSEEWLDLVEHAINTGKELNIQVDLTFGTGWPFGGPFIDEKYASTCLGGFKSPLSTGENLEVELEDLVENPESIISVVAVNISTSNINENRIIDLLKMKNAQDEINWKVPEGKWVLMWFFVGPTFQKVKRNAPGGKGLVLDHLNQKAFEVYSNKINTALTGRFGKDLSDSFGAFFCDSWEVSSENWTYSFSQTFQERNGYELTPYLPILMKNNVISMVDDDVLNELSLTNNDNAILYDYKKTHGDLIIEEFFESFSKYCKGVNVKCRVQPYSAPTDLLRAYGVLDILEIEGFGRHGIGTMYYGNVDPRLASSGAHVYSKDLVSCESFTWLGEHFTVSLEQIKRESDQIILHGVNRVIYHGCPMSPPEAGNPGWVFYASILANHNNTWWPYFGELNSYIARNAYLGHLGENVADFAVYIPIHDEWSGKKEHLKQLRVALHSNGHFSDFDYVNDERIINAAAAKNRKMIIGNGSYEALILWKTEYMPLLTAEKIEQLVRQGVKVIAIDNFPKYIPGYSAFTNGTYQEVEKIFDSLRQKPNCYLVNKISDYPQILLQEGISPDVQITTKFIDERDEIEEMPHNSIKYLHRRLESMDLFFVVNCTKYSTNSTISLRISSKLKNMISLNTLDLKIEELEQLKPQKGQEDRITLSLPLQPHESRWIIVSDELESLDEIQSVSTLKFKRKLRLKLQWDIQFLIPQNSYPKIESQIIEKQDSDLFDWATDKDFQYFSGTAVYKTIFHCDIDELKPYNQVILNLGELYEIAEVNLNETKVGVLWQGQRSIEVTHLIQQGNNDLEIRVTNLLLNKVIGYETKEIKWNSDYYFVNIDYKKFEPAKMKPLKSGLIGPISIDFYE
jgi:glycosyl hydrolase family 106( putative alpha-L-rhamnosidase)